MTFKELLAKNNMTGYKLSKLTGIRESTISDWNNQKYDPIRMPFEHAHTIAKTLEMSMEELYDFLSN